MSHLPVLLSEAIAALDIKANGVYVDATFGRGGHSEKILSQLNDNGRLIGIDQDQSAIDYGYEKFLHDNRFSIHKSNFTELDMVLAQLGIKEVDGILLDLGVSSPQLDEADRGFSFNKEGPLDMRMDQSIKVSAQDWINEAPFQEMMHVFKVYGEERFAKKIASRIEAIRSNEPITSTLQLADIVSEAIPEKFKHGQKKLGGSKKHPATKVFQAIRIHINQELAVVESVLPKAVNQLKVGGRLAVISFHSLEDRIVKRFFAKHSQFDDYPPDLPVIIEKSMGLLELIGKRVTASKEELMNNPRARSATLRIAQKNREGLCPKR